MMMSFAFRVELNGNKMDIGYFVKSSVQTQYEHTKHNSALSHNIHLFTLSQNLLGLQMTRENNTHAVTAEKYCETERILLVLVFVK